MSAFWPWWVQMWPQVFPNLIASLLWVPLAGLGLWAYHQLFKRVVARHTVRMEAQMEAATAKVHELSRRVEELVNVIAGRG